MNHHKKEAIMNEATGTAKGRQEIRPDDWITLKDHLTITFDRDKDRVEIGWACDCGKKPCDVPHTTLVVYVCPSRPCPNG
jgi:hypothetical protein